jgi:tetratricopeptide (TPR) repeat protein
MGCYRYQDVKTVPFEGLICLLWDVSKSQRIGVVDYLSKSSLIEVKEEYYLHPAIREVSKLHLLENKVDWEIANGNAAIFWTSNVTIIRNIDDALKAFESYHHYMANKWFDSAGQVISKQRECELKSDIWECLGSSFYRFGLLEQINNAIENIKYLVVDVVCLARLHLVLGYVKNLMGKINQAIREHEKSAEFAISYLKFENSNVDRIVYEKLRHIYSQSFTNIGLCKIDLWELNDSLVCFENYLQFIKDNNLIYENFAGDNFVVACFCLALCNSYLGNIDEVKSLIETINKNVDLSKLDMWSTGYIYLFLGISFNFLDQFVESFDCFEKAIELSKEMQYPQVEAKSFCGKSQLYRKQKEYSQAIIYHNKSIKLLNKIEAKCDLAEAYFQLGLTYQAMGEHDQAEEYKAKALELFAQMEAPKQIERVNKAFGDNIQ